MNMRNLDNICVERTPPRRHPALDAGPWEAQAQMDTGAAIGATQYRA